MPRTVTEVLSTGGQCDRRADQLPALLDRYRNWVEAEWGEVRSFDSLHEGVTIPAPLLAVQGDELAAGLSFASFAKPGSEAIGVWINTLYVQPQYRQRGIASDLVRRAQAEAQKLGIDELFVYTARPQLYQQLGWTLLHTDGDSSVLRIDTASQRS